MKILDLTNGPVSGFSPEKPYAIAAITKHGVILARKIYEEMSDADLYYPDKFAFGDESEKGITLYSGTIKNLLATAFYKYEGIIGIVSLGAIIRLSAPLLKDKKSDPAVIVVDEKGKFVIAALSGHLGGANELSHRIAHITNGTPVITTASDVNQTIAVDILGRELGWKTDLEKNMTPVSAAVVNEEPVALIQESGEKTWWRYESTLPQNIKLFSSFKAAGLLDHYSAVLVITHRLIEEEIRGVEERVVIYRPGVIVLGIGCNRDTTSDEIEDVIKETLAENKLSKKSVKAVATIDLKKDEKGLLDVVKKYGWGFVTYTPEELNSVKIDQPSETVFKYTKAYGVSEPAAKLCSKNESLLVTKKRSGNVTISVAFVKYNQ